MSVNLYGPSGTDVNLLQLVLDLAAAVKSIQGGFFIAPGAVTDEKVAANAAIAQSKIANLVADLANRATDAELAAETTARTAADNTRLPLAGGTLTGALVLPANAAAALQAVPKQQLDSGLATAAADLTAEATARATGDNSRLPLAGGTLTGPLVLPGDAASALQAVPKQQLDAVVASGIPDATTTVKGKVQLAGDLGGTAAAPTVPGLAAKADAAATTTALNAKLALAGGTMTGAIVLAADAAAALQAVPRQQLDAGLALKADAAATTSALAARALDSAVVHNTGAETIAGVKTFSAAPVLPAGALPESAVASLTADLAARALDAAVIHNTGAETIAGVKTFSAAPVVPAAAFPESAVANLTTDLAAKLPLAGGTLTGALVLAANAATALQAVPKQQLDSGLALKADDTAVVKLTGGQTIAGLKDFTTAPTVNGSPIGGVVPDADATTKGKLQLAGDLGGTAALPTVPGLANKLALAGGTMTGAIVLAADASTALQAVPKQQLDAGLALKADAAATTSALATKLPLAGGTVTGPLILAMSVVTDVPLTARGTTSHTADLVRIQDPAAADLVRVTAAGRQLIGSSTMLGVTTGVVDAMLVVNQPSSAIQTQIWRGSPRGDGFAYTARISDGAHFTTNGAITSNGQSALLPQPVREAQTPPSQYMFGAHVDLSPAINNAAYVSDTVNGIAHFNGFVQGGGLYPYFRIAYDGELQWSDGATSAAASFTALRREADGSFAFRPNGVEKVRIQPGGQVGINTATPSNMLTVDAAGAQLRIRTVPNRYRGDFDMSASGMTFTAYDDTGAVFMPYIVQAAQAQWRIGFTEKMRLDVNGDVGMGTSSPQSGLHVVTRSQFWPALRLQGAASQSDPIQIWQNSAAAALHSITAAGLPRWDAAANQQTTVGAAGGASAPPATPTKYLKVVDSAGTTLVIPAYAA